MIGDIPVSIDATTSTYCNVLVDGAPLDPLVSDLLIATEVDSSMHVPSSFRLVFRGMPNDVLLEGGFQLAALVIITTGAPPKPLIIGEVTSVEFEHAPDGTLTIVKGMDRCHRLMRGTNTMAYPEMTASDVVTALIAEAGVLPGQIIPTTTIYPWLTQANVSAWVFIQQLAAMENYVAYASNLGMFNFCPMPLAEEGLPPVETMLEPPIGTQLVMGKNLLRLRANVSGSEQVPVVTVTGYDPSMSMPVMGMFPPLSTSSMSIDPAVLPVVVAGEFEAKPFFDCSTPFDNQEAAMNRAESIASDIAGTLAEVEGECLGNPTIMAGKSMSIGLAGLPFDGNYTCTSARHVFEPNGAGYTTWFTCGGFRDRSLFALSSGAGAPGETRPSIPGVVIGTVVDNMDPEELGQVKVLFPWLTAAYVSAWARTMQIGASKAGAGFLWVPEVGDEVLVAFDRGHIDHPYVIGNLYNGVVRPIPPPEVEGAVGNRRIASRMMHTIQFDDGPEALGITIKTGTETCSIQLDAEQQQISLTSAGQVSIEAAAGVSIKAGADFQVEAGGAISIQGSDVTVTSAGGVTVAGSDVTVAAEGSASVVAPEVSLGA
jgi:hypothetical protein